jgi:putative colanic acid biosynthesis UDP-glucose lipid carrier transferase
MEAKKRKISSSMHVVRNKEGISYISVREKIFQSQYESHSSSEKTGPEVGLFFHELKDEASFSQRMLGYIMATVGLLILAVLYLFIAAGIKLSSRGPVLQRIKAVGQSGHIFTYLQFRTNHNPENGTPQKAFAFGRLLETTGLKKWPGFLSILQGDINFVGPTIYSQEKSKYWNSFFSEFYKRHAVKPGFVPIKKTNKRKIEKSVIEDQLRKELKYVLSPSLRNDVKVLSGNF